MKAKKNNEPKVNAPKVNAPKINKNHIYASGAVTIGFITIFGKFIIAAGIVSIIAFTSGKIVKRIQERRAA